MNQGATTDEQRLARNLRLIPVHQALHSAFFWLPVFVLFTRARFDLDGALLLAATYYLSVVVLEVPSGWLSDRFGRVITLRIASAGWVVAYSCYLFGGQWLAAIAIGQFFLAVGFASLSGTDVTFHFDTLESLGLSAEYTDRQARVSAIGYASAAASALGGGLLGLVDLRLAFAASLVVALAGLALTFRLAEPPVLTRSPVVGGHFRLCVSYLGGRYLWWIFVYGILMVVLEHVAFSVLQPWLTEVLGQSADSVGATPVVSGAAQAVIAFIGAGAARASAPVARRFGVVRTLVWLGALSAVIVTTMAAFFHPLVLVIVALRSVHGAAGSVLIASAVSPRVAREHRATLLSLNSLAGRLTYGLILLTLSRFAGDDVALVLRALSVLAWLCVGIIVGSAWLLPRGQGATPDHEPHGRSRPEPETQGPSP